MNRYASIIGIVIWLLTGCYDDQGKYDYRDVNLLEINFSPEPMDMPEEHQYNYRYKRPPLDTLSVTYTPVITQLLTEGEENLKYLWQVNYQKDGKSVTDSVESKELTLKFPPKQIITYHVTFTVTDVPLQLSYYRSLTMKTTIPYVNSWILLNGEEGDRKLSIIENPDSEEDFSVSMDGYKEIWGKSRFAKARGISYAAMHNSDYTKWESMTIVQEDSVAWLYTYGMLDNKHSNILFPAHIRPKFDYSIANPASWYSVVVDQNGKCYHAGRSGFYYTMKTQEDESNYVADKLHMNSNGMLFIWDKVNGRFSYYQLNQNSCYATDGNRYPENDNGNNAILKTIPSSLPIDEWVHNEIVWFGLGVKAETAYEGALAIGRNKETSEYNFYHFGGVKEDDNGDKKDDDKNSMIEITKEPMTHLVLNEYSCFAVSVSFPNQLFYTLNSKLFLYNMVSGESLELYDAGAVIEHIQFRIAMEHHMVTNENRCIGVVVNNSNGEGEFHEVFLDEAGDVIRTSLYIGFGSIKDVEYSFATRTL